MDCLSGFHQIRIGPDHAYAKRLSIETMRLHQHTELTTIVDVEALQVSEA